MSSAPTTSQLAQCLEMTLPELTELATNVNGRYHVYPLMMGAKKRWIEAPDPELKRLQRRLLDRVLYRLEPTPCAHGFVKGRSIVTNAAAHCGRQWVVSLDIKDFFPSVRREQVIDSLGDLFGDPEDLRLVGDLVTRQGRLPQGAPTSPHLANLAVRELDIQLAAMAESCRWTYTRYADDMSFSGDEKPQNVMERATRLVNARGFRVAPHKSTIRGQHQRQNVTGLTVNEKVALPKEKRRKLRAMLHNFSANSGDGAADLTTLSEIHGHLAFLAMVCPWQFEAAQAQLKKISG